MKKTVLTLLAFLCTRALSYGQCSETDITRVMLVGDSWANFMGIDNTLNTEFEKWGHSNYSFYTNGTIAVNGSQTTDFLQPAKLTEIQNQLTAHPDIDHVHLSLGGNDVLNHWNINYTAYQTDSLLDSIHSRLVTLIDFIKAQRPGIKIVWSGYCYPNFGQIIEDQAPFQSSHPFYATWQQMGFPDFLQINTILNDYSVVMDSMAANDPQIEFVKATGLMQYTFGQATPLTVPPGGSYPAFTAPLPEGYNDYPSPKNAMRTYLIFRDCFHLSPQGYADFIDYQTRKYYQKAFMDDQYFLSEGGSRDGSVSSTGNVYASLQCGNNGSEDLGTIVSFNTLSMPDTGIASASIFLRRESVTGTNPIGATFQVKISSGAFGASADVDAADFTDAGDGTDAACRFGSNGGDGHWIRLDLPSTLLSFITNDSLTQFMITAPGAAGVVTFSDASDPDYAPVLNVKFADPTGLPELQAHLDDVFVYPNPTNGIVTVGTNHAKVIRIEVYDVTGKLIQSKGAVASFVDLTDAHPGIYLLRVETEKGVVTKRVVRR